MFRGEDPSDFDQLQLPKGTVDQALSTSFPYTLHVVVVQQAPKPIATVLQLADDKSKTAKLSYTMGNKVYVTEHTLSYTSISNKSPQGLQCLKSLFFQYDSANPSRMELNHLLAPDFQDNTNGSDRNVGREETVDAIVSTRTTCTKHQIDLKHAWCIENSGSSHTVFFEAARFMMMEGDSDWTKVPISGRIEVKIKENRFKMKDAIAQITSRRMTSDASQLVRRGVQRMSTMPLSPAETPLPFSPRETPLSPAADTSSSTSQPSTSRYNFPSASELPALHTASHKPDETLPAYNSPSQDVDIIKQSPTLISGSSSEPLEKS